MASQKDGQVDSADKNCDNANDECAYNLQRSYYDEHEVSDDYGADGY
jgi:hypothetical protein